MSCYVPPSLGFPTSSCIPDRLLRAVSRTASSGSPRHWTRFIRHHLAGDVIDPGNADVEIGSAFLVAGPYDNVGNQDPAQKAQIRANTIDEMIRATGEAFLGLTIGCARCHDHKFDPISQTDYYQLYATLAGVRHGSRVVATAAEQSARRDKLRPIEEQKSQQTKQRAELIKTIQQRAADAAETHQQAWVREPADRRKTEDQFDPVVARFVRLVCKGLDTNPAARSGFRIDELEIFASESPETNVALASAGAKASGASRVIEDFPGAYGPQLAIDGRLGARFISTATDLTIELPSPISIHRVTFSSARGELKPDQPKFVFVSDYRIEVSLDGEEWTEVANGDDRKPVSDAHRNHRLFELEITLQERSEIARLDREIRKLSGQIAAVPALPTVWVGRHVEADAAGPFHVFLGGSPQRKGTEVITAASMSTLAATTSPYKLPAESKSSDRRMALADWVVDPRNPLTPRVLANRLWHYHFGTGIVATPSDFGYMGGRPSHPMLLDWLAAKLLEHDWRLKPLHKTIMMSRVYRQSSRYREEAAQIDAGGRLLWRFPPRRLSAEEIRDTMLAAAGGLDSSMGGPGFRLYRYLQDNVATYVPLDKHGTDTYRRGVYHQNARASRVDLMTDFDQPDCAFATARRAQTTTPLQALTTLNHTFTLDMAQLMAERLRHEAGERSAAPGRTSLCHLLLAIAPRRRVTTLHRTCASAWPRCAVPRPSEHQ